MDRKLIARGRTAEVYFWGENQVIKLFYDWVSPESVYREAENTRLAFQEGAPAPQIFELIQLENRNGIVYEWIEGPTILQLLLSKPWQVKQLSRQFAEIHFSIHQIPLDGMTSYRDRWLSDIERVTGLSADDKEKLIARVAKIPEGSQLCHFDFHPDQIVYSQRGVVILDWMNVCRGDPAADVARTKILLTIGKPPDSSWWMRVFAGILGNLANYYYQKRYQELNPAITKEMIQTWLAPVAAVRLLEKIEYEAPKLRNLISKHTN
jgi:aminoglycoside phosphotransferase (APT) family kinase protein